MNTKEEKNENLKTQYDKKIQKNQNNKADYKRKVESCGGGQ